MTVEKDFYIIGALNVTPDSFFDGGKYLAIEDTVKRAGEMLQAGADIIEIGGESSGPRSSEVPLEEELSRTVTAIHEIKEAYPQAHLSVDTWKAEVARQAIEAGVMMVNDVTAGRGDSGMFSVLASFSVKVVLMYSKDPTARTTIDEKLYENVIETIRLFLAERKNEAIKQGIDASRIILDPGLGHFVSSDPQYSFHILAELQKFTELGSPIFISPSRKSFLAGSEKLPTDERLPGTIVASALAVMNGATYIRTHDVLEVRRACEIASSIRSAT